VAALYREWLNDCEPRDSSELHSMVAAAVRRKHRQIAIITVLYLERTGGLKVTMAFSFAR
jgi:hypothetical protein